MKNLFRAKQEIRFFSKGRLLLQQSFKALKETRKLILITASLYLVSFLIGYFLVHFKIPFALEARTKLNERLINEFPFNQIIKAMLEREFLKAVIYTFLNNLIIGAFISTTLLGVIFFLPILVTISRGVFLGISFYGLFENFTINILILVTFILEIGAYCISTAAGIKLGLSFIKPSIYNTSNRLRAFKLALKEISYLYLLVIILLLLGAFWEIGGILKRM